MQRNALVFDTETTGLFNFDLPADDPSQPRLLSICAILLDENMEEVDRMYEYIKHEGLVIDEDGEACKVNGITQDVHDNEGKPFPEIWERYGHMTDACCGITSFGIGFDQKMLRGEARRYDLPDRYGFRPTWCMISNLHKLPQVGRRMKLVEAAVKIGIDVDQERAHLADYDTELAVALYRAYQEEGVLVWKEQKSKS